MTPKFTSISMALFLVASLLLIASPYSRRALAAGDATPPAIQSLSVSPSTVNAGQAVTITARITDAESGVQSVFLFYRLPNGSPFGGNSPQMALVSGTAQDGTWRAVFQVPPAAASGTWTVDQAHLRDLAGNFGPVSSPAPPLPNGSFTVIGSNDTLPPVIQSLSVSPITVSPGQSVTITARITDAESGVQSVFLFYRLPNGSLFGGNNPQMALVSGTSQDGTWQAVFQVPVAAASGTWTIGQAHLRDLAGNLGLLSSPAHPLPNGSFAVGVACQPRPRVFVTPERAFGGRMPVTIKSGAGPISRLQLGATSRDLANAEVEVVGVATGITTTRVLDLPPNTTTVTLFMKPLDPNRAATVPMVVTDSCGLWQSFIGGGPSAFR